MADDRGYYRFFAYLSLFIFAMLVLVLGDNYLVMFFGWEGVGLCSYLLIGYWFETRSAHHLPAEQLATVSATKAFIVNRIGDFGFVIGMFLAFTTFGTLSFFGDRRRLRQHRRQESRTSLTVIALAPLRRRVRQERAVPAATSGCRTRWKARRRSPP